MADCTLYFQENPSIIQIQIYLFYLIFKLFLIHIFQQNTDTLTLYKQAL